MRLLLCIILCALVTGCPKGGEPLFHVAAEPATPAGMAVANISSAAIATDPSLANSLAVADVVIGAPKNTNWVPSGVSSAALRAGLEESLKNNGLLSPNPEEAHKLIATVNALQWNLKGGEIFVSSMITYVVLDDSGSIYFDKMFSFANHMDFLDIWNDTDRNRIATETNVRENIQQFLTAYLAHWAITH